MIDYAEYLANKLAELRERNGVSARLMSGKLGQNVNYINHIENRKALPSMDTFFAICFYLGVTPAEFFGGAENKPTKLDALIENLKKLDDTALAHISAVVKEMTAGRDYARRR